MSVNPVPGNNSLHLKPGDEYVVAHVKLVNSSANEFSYSYVSFHSKSSAGNVIDANFDMDNTALGSGTLTPGGQVEGDVLLEVASSDHGAEMTWEPTIFSGAADYRWLLGL